MKRAFTLIELLVVIAIIAILAAILFPVFASAKLAAKKTVDLSNLKQTNLAAAMYLSDADDRYPIQTPRNADGSYGWGYVLDTPWDLRSGQDALYYEQNRCAWGNSVQPYMKSFDMLGAPLRVTHWPRTLGDQRSQWVKKPASVSYAMNGLLEQYPSTAVASPAQLIAFSAPLGGDAIEGGAFAQPYLYCNDPNAPCVYAPTRSGCSGDRNGEWSGTWWWPEQGLNLRASFGNGSNYAYADGSAKFRRMRANVNGKTDFRTDPYTEYDASGNAALSWYDSEYCHALLYRPDFDFQNYGTPVEGV